MSTEPLTPYREATLADRRVHQAQVLRLIRGGTSIADACASIPLQRRVIQRWKENTPGFREELESAKRQGRQTTRLQNEYLELLGLGYKSKDACAALGINKDTPGKWIVREPAFAARLERVRGRFKRMSTLSRVQIVAAKIYQGYSLRAACAAAGYDPREAGRWRRDKSPAWDVVAQALKTTGRLKCSTD